MRVLVAVLSLVSGAALAADGGWRIASLRDVERAPDFAARSKDPGGYMSVRADFDGDGRDDEAGFFVSGDEKAYAVFIGVPGHPMRHKVAEGPIADLPRLGLSLGKAGTFQTACGKGYGAAKDCATKSFVAAHPTLNLFTFESGARVVYWDGKVFRAEAVTD